MTAPYASGELYANTTAVTANAATTAQSRRISLVHNTSATTATTANEPIA